MIVGIIISANKNLIKLLKYLCIKNINSIMMFSSKLYFVLLSFLSFPKDNYLSKVEAYQK